MTISEDEIAKARERLEEPSRSSAYRVYVAVLAPPLVIFTESIDFNDMSARRKEIVFSKVCARSDEGAYFSAWKCESNGKIYL